MEWEKIIKKAEASQRDSVEEYVLAFSEAFSLPIMTPAEINGTFEIEIDLFPERAAITEAINDGTNPSLLLGLFRFWKELDWQWLFVESNEIPIAEAFSESSRFFIHRLLGFSPELLLSEDDTIRTVTFLLLYFLPCSGKNDLLFHYDKKVPLLSCVQITESHFKMLIYMMREYESASFDAYCSGYNLNHLLLESFMDNAKELYEFANPDWERILPTEKIKTLLDCGCDFESFSELRQKKHLFTFEELPQRLSDMEKKHRKESLTLKLIAKRSHDLDKVFVKI